MSMKINWISKHKVTSTDTDDGIYISVNKPCKQGKSERVRFRFSEGVHARYFKNADRILVGMGDNRLYFKPTKNQGGYKISPPNYNPHCRTFWVLSQPLADFIHEHPALMTSNLQYDDEQKLYYAEAACFEGKR